MEIGNIIKIKNPSLPFQKDLRYTITTIKKRVIHCYENSNPNHIYKNIDKNLIEIV